MYHTAFHCRNNHIEKVSKFKIISWKSVPNPSSFLSSVLIYASTLIDPNIKVSSFKCLLLYLSNCNMFFSKSSWNIKKRVHRILWNHNLQLHLKLIMYENINIKGFQSLWILQIQYYNIEDLYYFQSLLA